MDRETKDKTPLTLPMSRWLAQEQASDRVVAWRGEQRITLGQLRRDVAGLYHELNVRRNGAGRSVLMTATVLRSRC
ncbi:Uncharacterised protein [Serratia rubidaea]|uniref:Uncharacterized protein n=1 Tax=Serratia rubidaea TaxID=61652 RepID=A0A4U9HA35_SERRU|nr:Uncharacterised protein [Serratia rubidaea]